MVITEIVNNLLIYKSSSGRISHHNTMLAKKCAIWLLLR